MSVSGELLLWAVALLLLLAWPALRLWRVESGRVVAANIDAEALFTCLVLLLVVALYALAVIVRVIWWLL